MLSRLSGFRHLSRGRRMFSTSLMEEMFPLSMSGRDVDRRVSQELEMLGLSKENTLYAESSCVDEINRDNEDEDLSLIFAKRYGSVRASLELKHSNTHTTENNRYINWVDWADFRMLDQQDLTCSRRMFLMMDMCF